MARNTLANANAVRDWRIYADFAQRLIAIARPLYAQDPFGVDLQETVYALDTTTIDLCLSVFPWAPFRSAKAAIKLHTLLDLRGNILTFIHISDGKMHEVNVLDHLLPEPGAFYIMDRGFLDFERLYRFHEAGSFFVTRGKSNLKIQRRYSHPVDRKTGLICDQSVVLTGFYSHQGFEAPLRRIRFKDPETAKTLIFLTNNFILPASTITELYRCRWQVELFFESSTWCTPSDAMEFQEPVVLTRPLVGMLYGSGRQRISQRPLGAKSRVRPYRPASPATVSAESTAKQWSA